MFVNFIDLGAIELLEIALYKKGIIILLLLLLLLLLLFQRK